MDERVKLSFDDNSKVRVFEDAKFTRTQELLSECNGFASKVGEFREKTNALVNVLEAHAKKIDDQKLRVSYLNRLY